MAKSYSPLSERDKQHYHRLTPESLAFIRSRYSGVNRWVVADLVRRSGYRYPDKPALIYKDTKYTYRELEAELNKVANALLSLGLKKYDRVTILAHNTVHHVLTWLGTAKAGGIYCALNYLLRERDISYIVNHCDSQIFIVEDALYDSVKGVLSEMPAVKTLIWSSQGRGDPAPAGWLDFDKWYRDFPTTEPDVELQIEEPVQITYTSGTEALPKGVVLTNQSLLSEYMGAIVDGEYKPDDVLINALPLYHCAQRDVFLTPAFWIGATNVVLFAADPKGIMEAVEKNKATILFAPPTVWISILRHPDRDKFNLSSLRKCYYGASIMPVEVLKELLQVLPEARFYNYYGQTELSPYHTILKPEEHLQKLGSAGMGGLNMETRVEDDAHEAIGTCGAPGEICGRGPHTMLMYLKDPEATERTLAHGWFHSGDIGILDEDRYVTVADRKKDMIKTGGENVASREVEEAVYKNPKVAEVAVIGLPHEKWIEAVTAVVVPKAGQTLTEEEIIATCKAELAPFKVPKGVVVVPELPKNPSGKILKRDLRQEFGRFYRGS